MKTRLLPGDDPPADPAPPPSGRAALVAAMFETGEEDAADSENGLDWSSESLQAACERVERSALEARLGDSIGPYRLGALLGRGGMGAVYLAERAGGEFVQRVALKLIRAGGAGPSLAARFRRERAILATLDHPGIARLIDGGLSEQGELWYAMELVEGESLGEYCERHALDLRTRLRLFLQICDAVAFAHLNLVVHRDLKPANVMVTADGSAKLLDFGIAKLLGPGEEREALTRQDERVLTPEYAAPEQVLGQPITTATDVYALGLLLHEMLTGERAQRLAGLSALEAARAVVERDPPRPSESAASFARALRGDLDAIVGKALRKEPGRRYAGAQALAEDLRRYLSGHTVAARAGTWSYRAGKFVRRHRIGIAASVVTFAALLAGLVASLWQAHEAQLQAKRVESVKNFVTDLFRTVEPRTGRRGGGELTANALIEGGVERLRTNLGAQPGDRAEMLLVLSDLYWSLGESDSALALSHEALSIQREIFSKDDVRLLPSLTRVVVQSLGGSGQPEALALLGEADALLKTAGAQYDEERLRALHAHVLSANRAGEFVASEAAAKEELALQARRYGPDSPEVGAALTALAWSYTWQNRFDEAEATYRRAQALLRPDTTDVTLVGGASDQVRMQLGNLAAYRGHYAAAEREYQAVLASVATRVGPDHFYLRFVRQMIAYNAFNLGRAEEAEAVLGKERGQEFNVQVSGALRFGDWQFGRVLLGRGKLGEAEAALRAALQQALAANGPQAKLTQFVARDLGTALLESGSLDEARKTLEGALAAIERIETSGSYQFAMVESRYARLLLAEDRAAEAEARARHASTVLRERIDEEFDETARAEHELGRARLALGHEDGVALLRGAADNYERHFGRDDVRTAEYRFVLGEALLARAPGEARPMLDQAARALVAVEGNTLPVRARAERWLAAR